MPGIPDQGWVGGDHPTIPMIHYAVETFSHM